MDLENQGSLGNSGTPEQVGGHDWSGVYRRLVSSFAHQSRMDAEGLAQETMTRVVKWMSEGNRLDGPDGFVKFVYGCARNVLFEHRRGRARSDRELHLEEIDTKLSWSPERGPEYLLAMQEALSRLTKEERTCLIRAEFEEGEMLAKDLGIPLRTLRVRVFRIRLRLQALMNESRAPKAGEISPTTTP